MLSIPKTTSRMVNVPSASQALGSAIQSNMNHSILNEN
jgi:hypothetical protein